MKNLARARRLCLFAGACCAALAPAHADVWIVDRHGGGDFVEIQPAVDAASDGDTILVRHDGTDGRYDPVLVVGKGLALIGEDARARASGFEFRDVPAGSRVVVSNFDVLGAEARPAIRVDGSAGTVLVEACQLQVFLGAVTCEIEDAVDFVLARSVVLGAVSNAGPGMPGTTALDSNLVVYESTIDGGSRYATIFDERPVDGGPGVIVRGGSFHAAGSRIHGGDGEITYVHDVGADGASGVVVSPAAVAWVIDCEISGGRGGAGCCGSTGNDGEPFTGTLRSIDGDAKRIEAPPWAIENRTTSVTLEGEPGERVWLLSSPVARSLLVDPKVGFLHLGPPAPARQDLGTLPPTGVAVATLELPDAPNDGAVDLYVQGVFLGSSGQLRFGPLAHLSVMDESAVPHVGGRYFVDDDAAPGGDGSSWTNAVASLRDALAAAHGSLAHPAEVWVAEGTYRPSFAGGSPARSFVVQSGTHVYGGFAGTETELEQRDPRAHVTRLDGDLNGDDGPDFSLRGDNSAHVVRAGGDAYDIVRNVRLDGLLVRGGNARDVGHDAWDDTGGGTLLFGEVDVVGCTLEDNEALGGGAICFLGSRLRVVGDVLRGNRAQGGGAIDLTSVPRVLPGDVHQIVGSLVIGNSASYFGYAVQANAALARCRLEISGSTFAANGGLAHGSIEVHHIALGIRNSILWANGESELDVVEAISVEIDYSCVDGLGGGGGVGNIDQDPLFADLFGPDGIAGTADDDPRPLPGSPCNDAGDVAALVADLMDLDRDASLGEPSPIDLDGRRRRADDPLAPDVGNGAAPLVDMGAFERH